MRYRTQSVAYAYFVVALLLYGLQMVFGLLAIAKYLGPDPIMRLLPFDVRKAIHTNLLIVWVLTGFMGATYWLVPEESRDRAPLAPPGLLVSSGSGRSPGSPPWSATCSGWTEGNKLLEQPYAGEARDRRRDADVPVQHRDDDLEGADASRPPKACSSPASRSRRCSTCRRCSRSTTTR